MTQPASQPVQHAASQSRDSRRSRHQGDASATGVLATARTVALALLADRALSA